MIAFCNGGASKVVEDIMLGCTGEYLQELLIFKAPDRCSVQLLEQNGIKVHTLNAVNILNPFLTFRIRKYLGNKDIIHVHQFPAFYWAVFAKFLLWNKPRYIFTEHASNNNRRGKLFFRVIEKIIYRLYDKIVGVSDSVSGNIEKWIGSTPKLETVNNGINIESFRSQVEDMPLRAQYPAKYLISAVSRLSNEKDIDTPIRAMGYLDEHYHLLIVGDGELIAEKQELANTLGLSNKITYMGYRTDIASILNECDVNILSTYAEGLPISILESLAVGTPTLASRVAGVTDILKDDIFLFELHNDKELADKIKLIAPQKQQLQTQLAAIVGRFDFRLTIEKYKLLYDKLI